LTALIHLIEQAATGLNPELRRIVIDTRSIRPARTAQSTRNPQATSNACSISGQRIGGNSVMTAPSLLRWTR
jgi:hypothetical protein